MKSYKKNKCKKLESAITKIATENGKSRIKFSLIRNEMLVLNGVDDIVEIPHSFIIDRSVNLDRIFVGRSNITPTNHSFTLEWRDRHGIAWSDINGDRKIDAFIVRGGLKGQLGNIDNLNISDELFVQDSNGHFQDEISKFGFKRRIEPSVNHPSR